MRSRFHLAAASVYGFAAVCAGKVIEKSRRRSRLLAYFAVMVLIVSGGSASSIAMIDGQEPGPGPGAHPPPEIVEFRAQGDQFGMYIITGTVSHCDNLEGLTVLFGDAGWGHSAVTDFNGDFFEVLDLPGHSGEFISAMVTCRENKTSAPAYTIL